MPARRELSTVGDGRRPFVYIGALRRSGSTVLSELLTDLPRSFIFREPRLGEGRCGFKPDDAERLASVGVDLGAFERRWGRWWRRRRIVEGFARELYPRLTARIEQVGVKEIFHAGWRRYHARFPDMKVVLLGRDPRDIYISLCGRAERGAELARAATEPAECARLLNEEFERQREMGEVCDSMRVTYEAMCTEPGVVERILRFVESPLDSPGRAGQFNEANPQRREEAEVHGGEVTPRRIDRWKRETDPGLVDRAHEVLRLMPEYCAFWGYES